MDLFQAQGTRPSLGLPPAGRSLNRPALSPAQPLRPAYTDALGFGEVSHLPRGSAAGGTAGGTAGGAPAVSTALSLGLGWWFPAAPLTLIHGAASTYSSALQNPQGQRLLCRPPWLPGSACGAQPALPRGGHGACGEAGNGGESAMSTQWPSQTPEARVAQGPSPPPSLPTGGQVSLPSTCSPACCQPALTLPRPHQVRTSGGTGFAEGLSTHLRSLSSSPPGSLAPAAHPTPRAVGRNAGGWPPTSLPHLPEAPVLNSISCASGLHLGVSRD